MKRAHEYPGTDTLSGHAWTHILFDLRCHVNSLLHSGLTCLGFRDSQPRVILLPSLPCSHLAPMRLRTQSEQGLYRNCSEETE